MTATTDHIGEFFDHLAATPQPLLHTTYATIRVDLDDNGRPWHLTLDHGRVAVSRSDTGADAVVRTDRALLGEIVTGEANALTAALRGRLRVEGDSRLLVVFTRLLPGPPRHRTTVPSPTGRTEITPDTKARSSGKERAS